MAITPVFLALAFVAKKAAVDNIMAPKAIEILDFFIKKGLKV